MIPIKLLAKRVVCVALNRHEFDEHTKLRWCLKCGLVEIKEGNRWIPYMEDYNDDDMSPEEMSILSDELWDYLRFTESKGWN